MPDITRFFHPVLPAAELGRKRPVQVTLGGRRLALFRDKDGRAAALDDACPHRRAPLSDGFVASDGRLVCPYHGWRFTAQGIGWSPGQPGLGRCDTGAYQVIERWDHLWLSHLGVPESRMPALGWDGFAFMGSFTTPFPAPLPLALDNFSEDEHFPTVHDFLGWDAAGAEQVEFTAENFDDRTEVQYIGPQRRHPTLALFGVKAGDRFHNQWVTRFDPVHAVFTFQWRDPDTQALRPVTMRTGVFMVPETDKTTRFHTFIFVRAEGALRRGLLPLVRRVVLELGRREIAADARFVGRLVERGADAVPLSGMRLGKYDKPVIHNRKLLQRLYWGET